MLDIVALILLVAPLVLIVSLRNRDRAARPSSQSDTPALLVVLGLLLAVPLVLAMVYFSRISPSTPNRSVSLTIGEIGQHNNSVRLRQRSIALSSSAEISIHPHAEFAEAVVWANLEEQPFDASVYPSQTAAAKPIAKKIHAALNANWLLDASSADKTQSAENIEAPDNVESATEVSSAELPLTGLTTPTFFLIHDSSPGQQTLARFSEQLRSEFPRSEIRVTPHDLTSPQAAGAVRLVLRAIGAKTESAEPEQPSNSDHGRLVCDIVTSKGSTTVSADYIQKPWIEDFGRFVSDRPQQHFVVGYSGQLVSSAEAAGRLALQDAQNRFRIALESGVFVTADESHIVDRFTQKLSRPYGDVWREAVLLDVSRSRMQPVIMEAEQHAQVQQIEHVSLVMGLAILFGVTVLLCLGLNILTQGYYRNRLWTGVAAVVGLGLLATLMRFVRMT